MDEKMDAQMATEILRRLPLAKATLQIWRWIIDDKVLSECFEECRGRSYERAITFPTMVHLMADALINHQGNAKRCFENAIAEGTLNASVQAAYGKLRRMPIRISELFLNCATQRLRAIWPEGMPSLFPASLDELEPFAFDGKTIKKVKKLLKPLRGVKGGLIGGRATTALSLRYGIVEGMEADPDGHAAEVNMVPGMVEKLRSNYPKRPCLWVGDRGFCKQNIINLLGMGKDAFVLRHTMKLRYTQDNMIPERAGVDEEGRHYNESWGWIGTVDQPNRFRIRRIILQLGDKDVDLDEDVEDDNDSSKEKKSEELILITNLHEADRYPAIDLLNVYRQRWHIERVFQQVTEVFGLEHLIGSSPAATIFQFSFCLVLYNIIQLHRAFIAQGQKREVESISTEKYFQDVRDDLIASARLIGAEMLSDMVVVIDSPVAMRELLGTLLHERWKSRWEKAKPNPHRKAKVRTGPQPGEGYGQCYSAHRLLQKSKQESRPG